MRFLVAGMLLIYLAGCATPAPAPQPAPVPEQAAEEPTKYSDTANLMPAADREYKRMTRQRMEDDSDLQAGAGSLWVMEGQTSYLFAQNKHRRPGDPTQIKVEGSALKQLELKVATIQDLLKDLEDQKKAAEEQEKKDLAEKQRLADIDKEAQKILTNGEARTETAAKVIAEERAREREIASVQDKKKDQKQADVKPKEKEEKIDLKDVELIPSKVVEKMPDGLLRVTGQQTLMIKKRPYKVLAMGLVRPEDFDDNQISSSKMIETQFDIIHIKKDSLSK